MPDQQPPKDPASPPKDQDPGKETPPDGQGGGQAGAGGDDPPGSDQLGDAGKRALDAMKAERKAAKDEAADYKRQLDALQAQVDGKQAEHAAQVERERVAAEALGKANERILKAELRAAGAGKLADPNDALLYVELKKFEVGEDGEVDRAALTAAIDDLVRSKPYLGAAQGQRFQGGADQGARNDAPGKSIGEQIEEAKAQKNWLRVIQLEQQRAAELAAAKK